MAMTMAAQPIQFHHTYPNHSVMEDVSDDENDQDRDDDEAQVEGNEEEGEMGDEEDSMNGDYDAEQHNFYLQQQQQAMYYHQHRQINGLKEGMISGLGGNGNINGNGAGPSRIQAQPQRYEGMHDGLEDDDEAFSDDESSTASIPDENIDFSLTYAL